MRPGERGLLEFQPRLLPDTVQCPDWYVFDRVCYRDLSGFGRMFELVVVSVAGNFIPTIRIEDLDYLTGRIAFHLTTSLNCLYYNTCKDTCQ